MSLNQLILLFSFLAELGLLTFAREEPDFI